MTNYLAAHTMEGRFYYLYHSLKQKGIHGKGLKSMLITDARARILSKINACRLVIVSLTGKIFLLNETCEPLDRGTNNFVTPAIHTSNESSPLGQIITEMANFGRPTAYFGRPVQRLLGQYPTAHVIHYKSYRDV